MADAMEGILWEIGKSFHYGNPFPSSARVRLSPSVRDMNREY
ncbi:hypothetical protein [Variovorax sp. UC122_21]